MNLINLAINRFQTALQADEYQGIERSRRALSALAEELSTRLYEKEEAAIEEAVSVFDQIERADPKHRQKLNQAIIAIHRTISFDSEIQAKIEAAEIKKKLARG